jgi:tetratricopeptide (TPR) repeat protein
MLAEANLMIGNGYLQSGDYDHALEAFNNAIRRDPEMHKAYFLLGMTRSCRGEHGQAIGHYSQAIALCGDQESYYFCRAREFDALRRPGEALADYQRVLMLNAGHDGAKARYLELKRMLDEAEAQRNRLQSRARESGPEEPTRQIDWNDSKDRCMLRPLLDSAEFRR